MNLQNINQNQLSKNFLDCLTDEEFKTLVEEEIEDFYNQKEKFPELFFSKDEEQSKGYTVFMIKDSKNEIFSLRKIKNVLSAYGFSLA